MVTLAMRLLAMILVLGFATLGVARADPPRQRIEFVGNLMITGDELRGALEHPFEDDGTLNQEAFERYLLLVCVYYWDRGYAQVKVHEPRITKTLITIEITEGPMFSLDHVLVAGDPSQAQRAKHFASLKTRPGQLFSRTRIEKDRWGLSRYYEDRGYPHVTVMPLTRIDVAQRTVTLTFEITLGKRATIEQAKFWNHTKVPDAAFDRALTIATGERYNATRIEAVKRALLAVSGVKDAAVSIARGSSETHVVVSFEVFD